MINRNLWSVEENEVLKSTVKSSLKAGNTLKDAINEASTKLARSVRSCAQHWEYLKGTHTMNRKKENLKKLKGRLIDRGVRVHGNRVFITPTEGIEVIFKS